MMYSKSWMNVFSGSALPVTVQKLLKWKLSTITPLVVRKTVVNSNFKLVRSKFYLIITHFSNGQIALWIFIVCHL